MPSGKVLAWTERGNSVLQEMTCSQLSDSVRRQDVDVQQPFDVAGTWISTRYDYVGNRG